MRITPQLINKIKNHTTGNKAVLTEFFSRLKKMKPKELDMKVHRCHDEIFSETDCLECANCCKTISPALYESDIIRLADYLKMKVATFKDQYIKTDEDGDYIFRNLPCPFLDAGNYCLVYGSRPKACREYPHTDRKRFYQILDITAKNAAICPAVFFIIERLRSEI